MSVRKSVTLRLEPGDYDELEARARRLGTRPSALARSFVRAGLRNGAPELERRAGLEALEDLAALRGTLRRAGYPSVDAVRLMREVHVDLEQRPKL